MTTDFKTSTESPKFFWAVITAIAAASLFLRLGGATPDVSWLIDMCERILNGETAYIDIFETTPPIPTLLYMPGVILYRLTGVSAEFFLYAYAYAACFLTFALTLKILPEQLDGLGSARWAIILPAALFLFILSTDSFAQREFFGAVFGLPLIAVFVRRELDGEWAPFSQRFWAATLCGLSVAIKPPLFALPVIGFAAYYLLLKREVRFVYSSGLIAAAALSIVLTVGSLAVYPAYLDGVTTLMRDVYVPMRAHPLVSLQPAFIGVIICLMIAGVLAYQARPPQLIVFLIVTALGYIVVYFAQGKFFAYHTVPAAFFAFVTAWALIWRKGAPLLQDVHDNAKPLIVCTAIAAVPTAQLFISYDDEYPRLEDMEWAENLNRPTAMAITPSIALSFPLARKIDAQWVDRIHSQWVSHYTKIALDKPHTSEEDKERYRYYQDFDLNRVKTLISEKKPELVIQCISKKHLWISEELLKRDPSLLDEYEVVAEEGIFRIWRLQNGSATVASKGL